MADKTLKLKCSVCGDTVSINNRNCTDQHFHKYTGQKTVCYGSFLPIFQDTKGQFQTGNIMYISQKRLPWQEGEEPPLN